MSNRENKLKPDDRSDNVEKLQNMVEDTIENLEESREILSHSSGGEEAQIKSKNKRREEAIEHMRAEMKDEAEYDQLN